jgi:MFS family permease
MTTSFGPTRGFRALRHRNYRLFWSGQLVSLAGTWMQTVAQAWLILLLTNDPFWLGIEAAVRFAPILVFGLFGGVIADQFPKRRTLVATQASQMVLALALGILAATGVVQVWHVLLLSFLLGCTNAIDLPMRQAFVVEMVGRDDVGNAVALNSAVFNVARIVGPAIGGLAIAAFGVATCFFLNGMSFLAVIAGLLAMRETDFVAHERSPRPTTVSGVLENLAEGLRYVRQTPIVLLAISVGGLVSLFAINYTVTIPAIANNVLDSGASGYGFLQAAQGVGALAAALAIAMSIRPSVRVLIGGGIVLGVLEIALAASRIFPLSMLLVFGMGAATIALGATSNTVIQLAVPDRLRGRVISVYTTVFAGSTPIGGPLTGWIASGWSVPIAVGLGGFLALLTALAGLACLIRWPGIARITDGNLAPEQAPG